MFSRFSCWSLVSLLAVFVAAGVGCSTDGGSPADSSPAAVGKAKHVFAVRGMSCEACVKSVTKAIEEVLGVESVKVSLEEEKAFVAAGPDGVAGEDVVAAVKKAGFEAEPAGPAAKPEG